MKITVQQLKKMGVRPIEVARLCKVSQPSVYKWENEAGKIPERFNPVVIKELTRRQKLTATLLKKC